MPRHASGASTIRPDLGALAWEYTVEAGQRNFVGPVIFPFFPTGIQSGRFPYIPAESLLRIAKTQRAAQAGYTRIDWAFDEKDFATVRHGLESPIDDSERNLYQSQFAGLDVEQINTMITVDHMLRSYEKRVVDKVTDNGNLANAAASVKWNLADTADPRADVQTGIELIEGTTGLTPNTLVLSKKLFRRVIQCKAFIDHVKYTRAVLTDSIQVKLSLLADYLEVDQVLLASSVYNSSKNPKTFTPVSIWPDAKVLLAVLAKEPMNLKEPCLGRTFIWDRYGKELLRTETYREESTESDIYRVKSDQAEEFVFKGAGYLIHTAM
jgi:hypothetical protein